MTWTKSTSHSSAMSARSRETEQELRIELSVWRDRLAEARRHGWDDGIRNCKRHVAAIRRELASR